jgi:hypothetical protein
MLLGRTPQIRPALAVRDGDGELNLLLRDQGRHARLIDRRDGDWSRRGRQGRPTR